MGQSSFHRHLRLQKQVSATDSHGKISSFTTDDVILMMWILFRLKVRCVSADMGRILLGFPSTNLSRWTGPLCVVQSTIHQTWRFVKWSSLGVTEMDSPGWNVWSARGKIGNDVATSEET